MQSIHSFLFIVSDHAQIATLRTENDATVVLEDLIIRMPFAERKIVANSIQCPKHLSVLFDDSFIKTKTK